MKEISLVMDRTKNELFQLFRSLNPMKKRCFYDAKTTEIIHKISARNITTSINTRKERKKLNKIYS